METDIAVGILSDILAVLADVGRRDEVADCPYERARGPAYPITGRAAAADKARAVKSVFYGGLHLVVDEAWQLLR